jgi:hypothetical protein
MMWKNGQKGFVLLALIAAVLIGASPANAVDFAISGQINRAVMYVDDDDTGSWFFVDNDNSSTRFRFTGDNEFDAGWKVGIVWEVQFESNSSSEVSMDTKNTEVGGDSFTERKIEFWIEKWGRLWLGQGDMASNGTSEVDLSGTDVATYSSVSDIGGDFEFKDDGDGTGITVSNSRDNFDGLSRRDRVRYDTPKWAGFYVSGGTGQGSIWDAALRYSGDFGWAKLAAAAAYSDGGNRFNYDEQVSSSASLLFDFGLNLTASYAIQDTDGTSKDPWNIFGKVGYKFLEKHAASVQYSRTKHKSAKDDKGDTLGVGYVFSPWKSIEFYGTYYLHMLDRDEFSDPDDINIGMVGGRVKF